MDIAGADTNDRDHAAERHRRASDSFPRWRFVYRLYQKIKRRVILFRIMYDTNEKIATQGKGGFLFIYYIIASALIGDHHKTHKTKSPYI